MLKLIKITTIGQYNTSFNWSSNDKVAVNAISVLNILLDAVSIKLMLQLISPQTWR